MIDEKKLLMNLNNWLFTTELNSVEYKTIEECIKAIEEQPKTDWIPCEVDQPKEYGGYLYTDKNDEVHEGCYVPPNSGLIRGWSTCEADGYVKLSDEEVIAWQPLPQPYKKEGESDASKDEEI